MIKLIVGVETSKDGRKYATDELGLPMFSRTPSINDKLVAGAWCNVSEERQTMTRDTDGKLVPLEPHEQKVNQIITSVFATEDDALKISASPELFLAKKAAFIKQQTHAIAATYKVEGSLADAI